MNGSRTRGSARLVAVSVGLVLAAALAWFLWPRRHASPPPIELRNAPPVEGAALAKRRAESSDPAQVFAAGRRRLDLTEEVAGQLFPLNVPDQAFDPQCYLRHASNLDNRVNWPEHANGAWHLRTNSLGLREDRELAPQFDGLRVLCTGDSHTDGVCDNSESWPHRLEAELHAAHPDAAIEVINAGKGCYSFYHYRGVLERLAYLSPKLFVVAVYGGNDFMETTRPWYYFAGVDRPRFDGPDWKRVDAGKRVDAPAMAQVWTSVYYFHRFPSEIDVALGAALSLSADMAGAAEARGMRVLFVYIPSRAELDIDAELERSKAALAALELGRADLETARKMADRYLQGLASLGLPVIDMRATFRAAAKPPYWNSDLHIDVAGHAAIGAALAPWVEPLLSKAR
ncbi:MAG: SGNH/GDSL hydrolase family protein [Planctomycetes bacterium]|nr:SGNH/GDSL hydrolase family protein [Planctomycetota bacterium]